MSFKLMAQALDIKTGSSTTKLVLLKLCDNANDAGECWPSQSLIAEQCEMTTRTVITSIKKLEERGLLSVLKKRKNANKYLINLSSENISLMKDIHVSSENASPLSSENASLPYIEPTIIEPISERELTFKQLVKDTWADLGGSDFMNNLEAQKFFLHFSESNGTKMAFEKCKTFDIRKRMQKWKLNGYSKNTYSSRICDS